MRIARENVAPDWTRSFPVSKHSQTIGEYLKKERFSVGLRQSQAAKQLGVSTVSLSRWECDKVFPTAPFHQRIARYLGYDPFYDRTK
jgi:transcriptional regulator with XRE-family HTH domain